MQNSQFWLMPLILLPGVALIILSTSARFSRLHDEIHHLIEKREKRNSLITDNLFKRAKLFRDSLVFLYLCIFFFSTSALAGGTGEFLKVSLNAAAVVLMTGGIISLIAAAFILIRESLISYKIIFAHASELDD